MARPNERPGYRDSNYHWSDDPEWLLHPGTRSFLATLFDNEDGAASRSRALLLSGETGQAIGNAAEAEVCRRIRLEIEDCQRYVQERKEKENG